VDYADLDDDAATQAVRDKYAQASRMQNHAADNAIVEEIVCTNFMCHEHLSIQVGPLINFIIGHNGSGKSAVLTALTICMGGKATSTNRGQSLKSFIKEGKDECSLSVKIKNQGDSAYKPDTFGKSIIVERRFSRTGNSSFKVKNALGKTISTKRGDLEDILDFFALQLDNPMNVLTQDMARQFLNSSSPTEKYKFFIKGTHLELLNNEYQRLQEKLQANLIQIGLIEDSAKNAQAAFKEAEKRVEASKQHETLRDTIQKYSRQMAWAQVEEQEEKLTELLEELHKLDETIQERTTVVEQVSAKLEEAEKKVDRAKADAATLEEEIQEKNNEKAPLDEEFNKNRQELMTLRADMRRLNEQVESHKKKIETHQRAIDEERRRLAAADNGEHGRKLERIQDLKTRIEQLKAEREEHNGSNGALAKAKAEADQAVARASKDKADKVAAVQEKERHISQLSRDSGNWMSAFPKGLPELMRAISREARFREKPVGPLGRHVRLLKPEWSKILETAFGTTLHAFAVTSKADQVLLSKLIRETR
jgi:structural maintenance of chromosomes protein 6